MKFKIGTHHDEVLCNVLVMDVSNLSLGIPWKYDRKNIHEGKKILIL